MIQYRRVHTDTKETRELDNSVFRSLNSIYKNPLLASPILVQNIPLSTSDTIVQTKLGRQWVGYIITNSNAAHSVYTSATVNDSPSSQIILKAGGTVIVDILFF